jgi:hypothetical protein
MLVVRPQHIAQAQLLHSRVLFSHLSCSMSCKSTPFIDGVPQVPWYLSALHCVGRAQCNCVAAVQALGQAGVNATAVPNFAAGQQGVMRRPEALSQPALDPLLAAFNAQMGIGQVGCSTPPLPHVPVLRRLSTVPSLF